MALSSCLALLDAEAERAAFEQFYGRYKRFVYSTALHYVKTHEAAEDVSQEVFLYAAKNFQKFAAAHAGQILRYLRLCTEGRALNYLKKEPEEASLDGDPRLMEQAVDALTSEKVVMSRENIAAMHRIIAELPDRLRGPMELKTMEFEAREIAQMLNVPLPTVYSRIHAAAKLILERMAQENE